MRSHLTLRFGRASTFSTADLKALLGYFERGKFSSEWGEVTSVGGQGDILAPDWPTREPPLDYERKSFEDNRQFALQLNWWTIGLEVTSWRLDVEEWWSVRRSANAKNAIRYPVRSRVKLTPHREADWRLWYEWRASLDGRRMEAALAIFNSQQWFGADCSGSSPSPAGFRYLKAHPSGDQPIALSAREYPTADALRIIGGALPDWLRQRLKKPF